MHCSVFEDRHPSVCSCGIGVRSKGWQEATKPTFITLSTIFSYPLVGFRFTPQTPPCSYPFVWFILFFPRRSDFRNFPSSPADYCYCCALSADRSRWNVRKVDDKLPIECSSVSFHLCYIYVIYVPGTKIIMEGMELFLEILWLYFSRIMFIIIRIIFLQFLFDYNN